MSDVSQARTHSAAWLMEPANSLAATRQVESSHCIKYTMQKAPKPYSEGMVWNESLHAWNPV
jgi:hypothetical protein